MNLDHGVFTVSLDFELYWGVRDKFRLDQYQDNLAGVATAVRKMLTVFETHGIHATWATVGFLFFENLDQLKRNLPVSLPKYRRKELCPYRYLENADRLDPRYHFAPELIAHIATHDGQEIATHTFSHYYCLEDGQSVDDFKADIARAKAVAQSKGISVESLVFPRNQWNTDYLATLNEMGIKSYRGNESGWIHRATGDSGQHRLRRGLRLLDTYFNVSGHHTYAMAATVASRPYNFPASRFLRPYSKKLSWLDGLRLKRITQAMDDAAVHKRIFHLWWHPHNFGTNTAQNMAFLERIAHHYDRLREEHGMRSLNMRELYTLAESAHA